MVAPSDSTVTPMVGRRERKDLPLLQCQLHSLQGELHPEFQDRWAVGQEEEGKVVQGDIQSQH